MKQVSPKILTILFCLALLGLSFSCTKTKTDFPVVITVKYLSDTTKVVPGSKVVIEKNDVHIEGITDAYGRFTTTFKLEAILNVHATMDTGAGPIHFYGESTIRLLQDKTVIRSVFIAP
ncbi:MAG: hypothetical protein WCO63_10555 [Bacteroidota bacterium]